MKKLITILLLIPFFGMAQQNPSYNQADLDINSVRTSVGPGAMFWDLAVAQYEVPKGSNKYTIFTHDLWIGGIDDGGQLRLSAQTYRQNGCDYWAGPISDSTHHNDSVMVSMILMMGIILILKVIKLFI
jgi:hypothetical protein